MTLTMPEWLTEAETPAQFAGYSPGTWGIADGAYWSRGITDESDPVPFWTKYEQDSYSTKPRLVGTMVRCQCGSETFRLRYGGYSISAMCAGCGTDRVVYDG